MDDKDWGPREHVEFIEAERRSFQQRQTYIEQFRLELIVQAKLTPQERQHFEALVETTSRTFIQIDQEISAWFASTDPQTSPQPASPSRARAMTRQLERKRSQTLRDAQSQFEHIVGKKRLRTLNPRLEIFENFVQDEIWVEPSLPAAIGVGQELIR